MANYMKGRAQPVNWSYSAKQSHLPPKSPFSTMGPAFVDCSPSPFVGHTTFAPSRGACKQHQRTSSESFLIEEQPSWLDDLLNEPDTPVKKGSHRRSASDSVAFLEFPGSFSRIENIAEEEEFDNSGAVSLPVRGGSLDLDKLDQEVRPFSSYETKSSKRPPIRSWEAGATYKCGSESARESWKSGNLGKSSVSKDFDSVGSSTVVPEETQEGDVHTATGSGTEGRDPSHGKPSELDIDPKRAKQFAQRSRVRKLQYISELERNVSTLQAEESEVSAEVAFLNQQRLILTLENKALKQRIAGLAQEKLIKDAQHELLRKEAQRLRFLYQQQQLQHHSSMQTSHSHQIPTSADFDLQQLQFSKLSLGPLKQAESKPALSDAVLGIVKQIGGVAAASGHDDGMVCWNGRTDVANNSVPSNCMIAGSSKKLDNRRMMTGGGPLPVDFMLQNS